MLSLLAIAAVFIWLPDDVSTLGNLTVWSGGVCLATVAFALSTMASAAELWRSRRHAVRPGVYRYSIVVTAGLLIALAYLARWGVIGIRTWA